MPWQSHCIAVRVFSFDQNGDLVVGIYSASLSDVATMFGSGSLRRAFLARRLERIYKLVRDTGHLRRFIVFGSFVTRKTEPNDIDIFLIMENDFDVTQTESPASGVFDHQTAQAEWSSSLFWLREAALLTSEEVAIAYWQIKRDLGERGIIEIVSE